MRMPGEPKAEFLLLQPMIAAQPAEHDRVGRRPQRRPELRRRSAPTASRPTRRSSGRPRSRPGSTRTRSISAQISLWNQSGSAVIRGNLIVVPVGDSLLYLQPVYLQSTSSAFPEFQKIVVASPTTDRLGRPLGEALTLLLAAQGGRRPVRPTPAPRPGRPPTPGPSPTPAADAAARAGCRPTSRASSTTRTRTSSSPRRRSGTATSRRTARRWTRSRPRSSASARLTGAPAPSRDRGRRRPSPRPAPAGAAHRPPALGGDDLRRRGRHARAAAHPGRSACGRSWRAAASCS